MSLTSQPVKFYVVAKPYFVRLLQCNERSGSELLRLELSMGLDELLSTFICSMELDSKNGSLAGQSLNMMLLLVCPEFKHKSWNYFGFSRTI